MQQSMLKKTPHKWSIVCSCENGFYCRSGLVARHTIPTWQRQQRARRDHPRAVAGSVPGACASLGDIVGRRQGTAAWAAARARDSFAHFTKRNVTSRRGRFTCRPPVPTTRPPPVRRRASVRRTDLTSRRSRSASWSSPGKSSSKTLLRSESSCL